MKMSFNKLTKMKFYIFILGGFQILITLSFLSIFLIQIFDSTFWSNFLIQLFNPTFWSNILIQLSILVDVLGPFGDPLEPLFQHFFRPRKKLQRRRQHEPVLAMEREARRKL